VSRGESEREDAQLLKRESHIEQARRHVAESEQRVFDQAALIERLRGKGQETVQAEKLLAVFEATLAAMREHLESEEKEGGNAARET
jgi:hypothetical protein